MRIIIKTIIAAISVTLLFSCNQTAKIEDAKPMSADEAAAVLTAKGALSLYETGQWQKIVDSYYTEDAELTWRGATYDKAGWVKAASEIDRLKLNYKVMEYSVNGDNAIVRMKIFFNGRSGYETYHMVRQSDNSWKIKKGSQLVSLEGVNYAKH